VSTSNLITVPGLAQAEVTINTRAYTRRAEIIEAANFCPPAVTDADTQAEVANVLRDIARLLKETEDGRKLVKAPVLDLGKRIDAAAAEFVQTLEAQNAELEAANRELVEFAQRLARFPLEEFGWDKRSDSQPLHGWNDYTLYVSDIKRARNLVAKHKGAA
jgi:hypothetical protein